MTGEQAALARRILAHHSKSFALAARLLPTWCRLDAAALYAWCRRCDDAVDFPDGAATPAEATAARVAAVARLREELDRVYAGATQTDAVLACFQDVVWRNAIPRSYADDLVQGMAMDVGTVRYRTVNELLLYCYRAAGTVGLMMAQVMKVRDPAVLRRAADLGMAMQITNICRDVAEDQSNGRVYLPQELLRRDAALGPGDVAVLPTDDDRAAAAAVAALLRRADELYRSADVGLAMLPLRCAIAIRAARLIYAEIGTVIASRRYDVRAGRAVVSRRRKLWLLLAATAKTLLVAAASTLLPRRIADAAAAAPPPSLPFAIPALAGDARRIAT